MSDPDELLCYCTNLTWGQIRRVAQVTQDFEALVRQSGACTGCGSCQFDVEELVSQAQNLTPEIS